MKLKKGDHVRLKIRTISGWKGTGIVLHDQYSNSPESIIKFRPDDADPNDEWRNCHALRRELSKIRTQGHETQADPHLKAGV